MRLVISFQVKSTASARNAVRKAIKGDRLHTLSEYMVQWTNTELGSKVFEQCTGFSIGLERDAEDSE